MPMSNDPFSEFSKIFAGEFGRALTTAWQKTLSKSFAQSFGHTAKSTSDANNPFEFFQQFLNAFPGADRADFGGGADYLQFGQFFKPYLDMFNAGAEPADISAQMSKAFRDGMSQFVDLAQSWPQSWQGMVQNLGHLDSMGDFFQTASKVFSNQMGAMASAPMSALSGDFGIGEFTDGKTPVALGPAREWQLAVDAVVKAADRLRAAQARMQEYTTATFDDANERFWRDLGSGDDELTSLKEVYDYWVNCAEDAYYDIVMTDDYSRDFGEAINSQADFKIKFTALIDRFLEMLNVPNRRELNGVIQQLARIERRLEALEKFDTPAVADEGEKNSNVEHLKHELGDLRAQVHALDDAVSQAAVVDINRDQKSVKSKSTEKPKKKKKNKSAQKNASSQAQEDFDVTNITGAE